MRDYRFQLQCAVGFLLTLGISGHYFGAEVQPRWDPFRQVYIGQPIEIPDDKGLGATSSGVNPQVVIFPAPPLQVGWPVTVGGRIDSTPTLGDLDNDGDLEVVFQSFDGLVRVHHHDGTMVNGWPQPGGFQASAAIANIDASATLETFIGAFGMRGFFHDGHLISGWPQGTGRSFKAGATIDDLDGDGELEIIGPTTRNFMHVWEKDGSNHPGWPRELIRFQAVPGIAALAAVGDLVGDERLEIVAVCGNGHLYIWDQAGEVLPGYPKFMNANLNGEPALGDLDGDGELEIAFGTDLGKPVNDRVGRVFVLNPDGSVVPGWPQVVISNINGGVAIGDVNGDGTLEVVAETTNVGVGVLHGRVWVWNGEDGSLLPGWPQVATFTGFNASPVLGDLNGDGRPDVLAVGLDVTNFRDTLVWAWNADGSLLEGFPFRVAGSLNVHSSPTIADLDGDGDVEVGFGTENPFSGFRPAKMFFFDLPAPYDPSTMEWPTLSHDFQRTGRYSPPPKRKIPLEVRLPQPFLNLNHPPAVVVAMISSGEAPDGPFSISAINGVEIEGIEGRSPRGGSSSDAPGRAGRNLIHFDGPALAEAIRQVSPEAEEVLLTITAPKGARAELTGEVRIGILSE